MSPAKESFDERLQQIVQHAYANAPAVRDLFDRAGVNPEDIQGVADLSRLPVTSKDQLVAQQQASLPFGGWLAVPAEKLRHIFISPGPIFDPEAGEEAGVQGVAEAFQAVGIGPGDVVLNTFLYHMVPAGLLMDAALNLLGATVVPTGPGNTDFQVQIAMALRATGFVGTPSFLKIILDEAEKKGIPGAAFPIKKAFFSAEPYPPSLRKVFEEEFGMRTGQAYATADLGVIAYECEQADGLHYSSELIVEVVGPEGKPLGAGQQGEVVVTTFNQTYPLIRLGTGDLSAFVDEPCACGRPGRRLLGWMGRVGDAVKVRGMFLHPNQLQGAVARFPGLGRFQAVVTRPETRDIFTLKIELTSETADRATLADALKTAVREACRLGLDSVEFLGPGSIPQDARPVVDERTWE
jgi:phenylacetate-CoA ligase